MKVEIDGKVVQVESVGSTEPGTFRYIEYNEHGVPIREHSFPFTLKGDMAFRTNGHHYKTGTRISPKQVRWKCPKCGSEGWTTPGDIIDPRHDHDRPDGRRCIASQQA